MPQLPRTPCGPALNTKKNLKNFHERTATVHRPGLSPKTNPAQPSRAMFILSSSLGSHLEIWTAKILPKTQMSVFESRIDHLVRLVSLDGLQRGDVEAGAGVRGEQGPRGLFKKNFCVFRIKYAAKMIFRTSPRCQHLPDGVVLGGHRVATCFKMQPPLLSHIKETFFHFEIPASAAGTEQARMSDRFRQVYLSAGMSACRRCSQDEV